MFVNVDHRSRVSGADAVERVQALLDLYQFAEQLLAAFEYRGDVELRKDPVGPHLIAFVIEAVEDLSRIIVRGRDDPLGIHREDALERIVHDALEAVGPLPFLPHEPYGADRLIDRLQDGLTAALDQDTVHAHFLGNG